MEKVYAPWTQDQIDSLNKYQESRAFHPFTGRNDLAPDGEEDILIATTGGWNSQYDPSYQQDWAWETMTNWEWKKLFNFLDDKNLIV
jgi:hypothetical protein